MHQKSPSPRWPRIPSVSLSARRTGRASALVLLAAALTGLLTIAPGDVPSAGAAETTVDNSSSQVTFGDGWWGVENDSRHLNGSEQVNRGTGASARLTFNGSKITVVYSKGPDKAIANVTIDGQAKTPIDQYSSSRAFRQQTAYSLSSGQHTIVVTNSGDRSSSSSGWGTGLDAFIVDGAGGTSPTSTSTATATSTATRVPSTATPTATQVPSTATPTATSTAVPTPPPSGDVGSCGESMTVWHGPQVNGCAAGHEHGDAPPAWLTAAGVTPSFQHHANTPGENEMKHSAFKGFTARFSGVDLYVVAHLDTSPLGHPSRFHSYQLWARDPANAVSHWHGWMDFGTGNMTGPYISNNIDEPNRPIMAVAFQDEGLPKFFESWYGRAGGSGLWAWDFGFNISTSYYAGPTLGTLSDPNSPSSWLPTGQLNLTRRIEASWYGSRSSQRGHFWSTQFGQLVSGPSDPACGRSVSYGTRTYTVVCLEQHIAPSMPTVAFPGNSVQKTFDGTGVRLPN